MICIKVTSCFIGPSIAVLLIGSRFLCISAEDGSWQICHETN